MNGTHARKHKLKNKPAAAAVAGFLVTLALGANSLNGQSVSLLNVQQTVLNSYIDPGLAVDTAGNVYYSQATYTEGVSANVIKLAPNGSQTTLASNLNFNFGIVVDTAGNVYATNLGAGSVIKIAPDGSQSTFASGLGEPQYLAIDKAGNVYVTAPASATAQSQVWKITPDGSKAAVGGPWVGVAGVAVDSAGNVYAIYNSQSVVKVTPEGTQSTVASGIFDAQGEADAAGLAVDANGNIYVSEFGANTVTEIAPGGAKTVIASGLNDPQNIALDSSGNLYIADVGNNRILKVTTGTGNLGARPVCAAGASSCGSTYQLTYSVSSGGTLGTPIVLTQGAPNLDFTLASGSTCTGSVSSGLTCTVNVNFAPQSAGLRPGAVELTDSSGDVLATTHISGVGLGPQIAYAPGTAITLASEGPLSVAVDEAGNVYYGADNIYKIPASGGSPIVLANIGTGSGMAVDGAGNLFVADTNNDRIVEIQPNGTLSVVASGFEAAPGGLALDGAGNIYVTLFFSGAYKIPAGGGSMTAIGSGLNTTGGLAVDAAGNVFIADSNNNRVVEVPANGGPQSVIANVSDPTAVAVDAAGNVYISAFRAGAIEEIPADGSAEVTMIGGLNGPLGIAVDAGGNLFICDASNQRLLKLQRSQAPTLSFQTTNVGATSSDSPRTVSIFNIGNQPLAWPVPASGTNPAIGSDFTFAGTGSSPCPAVQSGSESSALGAGSSCGYAVSFTPLTSGSLSEVLTLTDNNLNGNPATQLISLSGTGVQLSQTISFAGIPTQTQGGTLTLSAAASSGLPVSFSSTTTSVCTISGTTLSFRNGGTCTIVASQPGNAQYAAAASVSQSFTVLKLQTITFKSIATQTVGANVSLSASSSSGSGIPITFSSLTASVCTVSGSTVTTIAPGTCTIEADQAGSSLYAAATPVTESFTVNQASQTISFTGLPATATFGSAGLYTLNATASSGLAVTYTVTGPATISGTTLTITGAGTVVVTASQAGNTNYAAATPVSQTITVGAASQTITFAGLPAAATYGSAGPYTLNATASSGLAVTYAVTGPVALSGNVLTITGAGTVVVTASQTGNANYAAATPVSQTITVANASGFTITPIPGSETVHRGVRLAGFILELQSVNGFSGNVKLTCSGDVPSSVCVDLPQTVPVKGTAFALTGILFPQNIAPGTYTITFTGVCGAITATATAKFTVQ